MKECIHCKRLFSDADLVFCIYDGERLQPSASPAGTPRASAPKSSGKSGRSIWPIVAIVVLLMVVFGLWQSHGGVGKGNDRGISATLRDAADAEATAARSLDESALEAVYGGSALERERQVIETLRESGVYADAVLKTEDIERIHFSNDGERATAVVTETWQLTMYSVSGGALVRGPIAQTDRQLVTFVRDGNHWLIDDLIDQGLSHG